MGSGFRSWGVGFRVWVECLESERERERERVSERRVCVRGKERRVGVCVCVCKREREKERERERPGEKDVQLEVFGLLLDLHEVGHGQPGHIGR